MVINTIHSHRTHAIATQCSQTLVIIIPAEVVVAVLVVAVSRVVHSIPHLRLLNHYTNSTNTSASLNSAAGVSSVMNILSDTCWSILVKDLTLATFLAVVKVLVGQIISMRITALTLKRKHQERIVTRNPV